MEGLELGSKQHTASFDVEIEATEIERVVDDFNPVRMK